MRTGGTPRKISDQGCVIYLDVTAPECDQRSKCFGLNVIVLPQLRTEQEIESLYFPGKNDFCPDELLGMQLFGGDNRREDPDATIVLGDFSNEENVLPPKVLLLS